jgi:hypothetical protein
MVRTQVRQGTSEITVSYPQFPFDGIFRGDGVGGFVCFICGRTMDRGEPLTCVSRLLQIHEDNQDRPSVVDAVASSQVCLPCTLLSAHHRPKWTHIPKLTGLEWCSFCIYARLLAAAMGQLKSDIRVPKEVIESLLCDVPYFFIEQNRIDLLGGVYRDKPVSIISNEQCPRCYTAIDSSKPHISFQVSIDTPRLDGISQSNIWRLAKYCDECSNGLLPLCDRLW